jgi:hypothetical protein
MKHTLALAILVLAACSKPQEKEATVKEEAPKAGASMTSAGLVTGESPAEMVEKAKKVAASAQANLDEKGAGLEKDE